MKPLIWGYVLIITDILVLVMFVVWAVESFEKRERVSGFLYSLALLIWVAITTYDIILLSGVVK